MKKKFWILLALLMLCLAAVSAAGCSKKQSGDSTVLLSGFESVDELLSMNWQNMFGAADVVEDDDYVTQGEHAAKLSVRGDYSAGTAARPSMTIYTNSEWLQKTDYSDTTKMTVDVYNAQDETVNMYFQFGVLNEQNTYQYSSETKIELQPGANSVEIPFDRAFLDQLIDIKNIMRLLFMFDNETVKNQPARVLYMDNFVAHTTTEPIPTDVKIRQENEIESADRAEYISSWSIINYIYSPSELAHNTDPQFITQGTGSFKFSAPATGGGTTSPGIKLSEPAISDISSYYSISFDIYNDNDKDFAFHTLTFKTFGVAKAKSWTRFEFTIDQLENSFVDETLLNMQGYDPSRKEHYYDVKDFKNFTLMTTNDSADAPITFYIDNFFANPKDLSKPIINVNGEYAEEVNLNEQYTVPSDVTVSKGTLDKWVILGPDGTQIGEDNAASFTPAERGTYTIVYTATNENGTSEFKIEVYAGLPPTILLDTPNITILPGQYTVPVPEVDNNGTLSWKVYRITDSVRTQIGENSAPSFNAEGGFYQVEYTAVNDEAERTAYHNVLVIAPTTYTSIVSAYPDLYSADKLTASVGSASITSNKNYTLGDGNAIRMSGSGNVTVEYAFGADVGTAQTFGFAIYNPTASDLTFTFGMATTYNLAAHGWLRFDLPVSWYTEWKCINAETNILDKVNFSVSGSGEIEAYLTFFTLSPVQAGPAITVAAYEDHMPELSAYTVPAATASGGAAVMHEVFKRSGNDWALFASNSPAAFTPDAEGEYKIVYTAENVYGTSTREITVLFGAVPEIQLDFTDKRINEGTYTVEMPDVENAESVSWVVYQIASNLLYGDGQRVQLGGNSPASFTAFAGLTYEIVYTSSNDVATVTAVQRLAVEGGIRLEEKYPDAFAAGNIHAAAGDVTATGGWLTDKTLVGTGSETVDFTFEPDIYLSAGLTAMPFWVMNGSDGEVKLTIAGSKAWSTEYVLQPGIWYRVDLPLESHLRIWGVVSADNYLQELGLKFTGTGDLTVYIDLFSVHMSGEAVAFNVPSDIVTEIDVGEPYTVPTITAKDGSAVTYVITDKDGDPVNSSWLEGGVFTPEMGGTYTITYSAANVFGSSTYEIVLQCGEVPEIVLDFTDKNIAAGTYTVTPPVVADADISWVVYQINTNMLYGDGLRVQLGGDSPASFTALAGHMYEIVYTAVNDSGKVTAAQRLTVETGASLAELYPEAITADNITAESCEVSLETGYLTDKAIVAKGSNSFSVIFGADIYLSAGLNNFTVWVLNESAESITLIVNGKSASYTLVPGLWYRVDLSLTPYLRDWGIVDADNFLKSLGFSFTGTGEISVCIDRMSIGRSGEAVAFNVPSDIVTEIDVNEPYTVPAVTAKDGSQVSWKVLAPDETQVGEDNAAEFTPMQGGKYSIVYSAANVFGSSEYRLEITVTASTPVLTEIDGHVHVNTGAAGAASYTIIPPTAEDGSQVT